MVRFWNEQHIYDDGELDMSSKTDTDEISYLDHAQTMGDDVSKLLAQKNSYIKFF